MPTLVIVGAQWGDEAKGKLVDVLSTEADFVVRFSGGNNAGHTVIVGDDVFKFHLLPAGILYPHVTAVLGAGMVVCPVSLLEEIDRTKAMRPGLGKLVVSSAAHVVFPYHRLLDQLEEEARGKNKIGTTSRGIGPAYTDKVQRTGIRMGEFVDPPVFRERLGEVLAVKNKLLAMFGHPPLDFESLFAEYNAYAERMAPHVASCEGMLQDAVRNGQKVMFEGAQGTFLDLDHGTYPYVTSSHPIAGGACLGTGIGPRDIGSVLGVCKSYATRVGSGPFPTELLDDTGDRIREQGHEYGTTTGRPRRCGWMDLVALKHSCRVNSMSGLVITRIDVLSGFDRIRFATKYEVQGSESTSFPVCTHEWEQVQPVYEEMAGWGGNISGARTWEDLPSEARDYVRRIEEFTETPAAILSIGPDRSETIVLRPDLVWG
ncbi:MAG: adenylosuccinate synthase [Armatimonadetes bacterium]|nr:adenylosuccinate synthase [Armatimonadota bacterium]